MLKKTIQILAIITVVMSQTYLAAFALTSKKSYLFSYLMLPLDPPPSLFLCTPLSSTPTSPILIGMELGRGINYFTTQDGSTSLPWIKWPFWTLEVPYISNQRYTQTKSTKDPKLHFSFTVPENPLLEGGRREPKYKVKTPLFLH